MLSKKDIKLLNKAIIEKDKYKIQVDNDSIILYQVNNDSIILYEEKEIEDSNEEFDEYYENFDSFGEDFIVDLLQYLGADADYC